MTFWFQPNHDLETFKITYRLTSHFADWSNRHNGKRAHNFERDAETLRVWLQSGFPVGQKQGRAIWFITADVADFFKDNGVEVRR